MDLKLFNNRKGGLRLILSLIVGAIVMLALFTPLSNLAGVLLGSGTGESFINPEEPGEIVVCQDNHIVCRAQNNQYISDVSLDKIGCCDFEEDGVIVKIGASTEGLTDFDKEGGMGNKKGTPSEDKGDVLCGPGEVICGAQNADDTSSYKEPADALSNLKCCPAKGIFVKMQDSEDVRLLYKADDAGERAYCEVDEIACGAKHDSDDADILDYIWCCKYETFEITESGIVSWSPGNSYHFSMGGYLFEDGTEGEVLFDYKQGSYDYITETGGATIVRFQTTSEPDCITVDYEGSTVSTYYLEPNDFVCVKTRTGNYVLMEYKAVNPNSQFKWEFQE